MISDLKHLFVWLDSLNIYTRCSLNIILHISQSGKKSSRLKSNFKILLFLDIFFRWKKNAKTDDIYFLGESLTEVQLYSES